MFSCLNQPSESDIDPDKSSSTATSSTPTTELFERCEAILQDSYKKLTKLDQLLRKPPKDYETLILYVYLTIYQ